MLLREFIFLQQCQKRPRHQYSNVLSSVRTTDVEQWFSNFKVHESPGILLKYKLQFRRSGWSVEFSFLTSSWVFLLAHRTRFDDRDL